jgi:hypothetical protein
MMHFDTELNYPGKSELLQLSQGLDQQSINLHTLEKILTHAPFFTHTLEQSFKDNKFHIRVLLLLFFSLNCNVHLSLK